MGIAYVISAEYRKRMPIMLDRDQHMGLEDTTYESVDEIHQTRANSVSENNLCLFRDS
jgi:hypothetical protein